MAIRTMQGPGGGRKRIGNTALSSAKRVERRSSTPAGQQQQVQPYPTTPAPLPAHLLQEFAERRSQATRGLGEALARRTAGTTEANALFEQGSNRARRNADRSLRARMEAFGDKGVAFSPRFAGRARVDVRDALAENIAVAEQQRQDRLSALNEAVRLAEVGREDELAAIDRDTARAQSDLAMLIRQLGA